MLLPSGSQLQRDSASTPLALVALTLSTYYYDPASLDYNRMTFASYLEDLIAHHDLSLGFAVETVLLLS